MFAHDVRFSRWRRSLWVIVAEFAMPLYLKIAGLLLCLMAAPAFAQDRATAWEGKGADGKTIRFDPQHLQRPTLLLFWATWCPYCEALMPHLQNVVDAAGKD